MKTISIGNNGDNYPMYQKISAIGNSGLIEIGLITEEDKTIEIGDTIEKGNYKWCVKEIVEKRIAKGKHAKSVTFQKLIVQ